jgi:hypothetical protein
MKQVMGGVAIEGNLCNIETACSLVVSSGGQNTTYYGECGQMNGQCKCVTDFGNYEPSSNGGLSRCDA